MAATAPSYAAAVEEITTIYKSLPPRPSVEEVAAANSVLQTVESEQNLQLEEISKHPPPQGVPPELFSVLQEVKKAMVSFRSHEQRKEAADLVELDRILQVFDGLIQKASSLVSGRPFLGGDGEDDRDGEIVEEKSVDSSDDDDVDGDSDLKSIYPIITPSSKIVALASAAYPGDGGSEKLNLMDVAAAIENSFKTGATHLDLRGKLMDKVEWLPFTLGKLSTLSELNLSENRIMALPNSIASLKTLMKLDVHGNQLINLPSLFGELHSLTDLDLSGNLLKSLPESFRNLKLLINLDLSSNRFSKLPTIVGDLCSLQRLNVETNDLEELPYTIGSCSSLVELRLDFNMLKALPEGIGKLERLEILTLHFNRVKRLPSTMGGLSHLKELDASFNELESIPETLCDAVSLEKLNVGKNFADLRALPESLGNLKKLEDLDICDNQIRVLPDSFRFLSRLRNFRADQTPLQVPPMKITESGAQAVVEYMAKFVVERDERLVQRKKKRGVFAYICPLLLCFGIGKA
ncbi:plant intracellular Ras-group-related LRR protein 5-like isoform X2 [Salvia miltiorrhiza]|uniref:plant intracellular Ras-group-related LRR protein 5-like isoform X2 n=1 Tax=Salvia miltiorrhiza TaxID=226208 RepID=UPI0025AD580C|nr:plant intracellular Ras-group-related LRR protein 5-like isoform X2 [Salvia miltiorrhiza]